ncbi:TPA: DUF4297 domain-containing protein [Proteus mirabilis]|uniref:DUF4297 domain-containing protein n=1 Tax=Proteus TaxID=583 RepID=UPI000668793D|nr:MULTISPECIES: DUF4297 domain-containing protein [Proteus]EHU8158469.1 DUF4297 domain-containing protein [Salmonella enterica]ELA7642158.1 DUF4297 domain-containing protein [Proteus mirabilis]ELA7644732.1 DUF4297 domain-containing protein [Proteus mirabilis]ELH3468884.1 DUF4297 domain-containing protein [Salmonella enterica]EMF0795004.1 DUF4297 domain-containing protein [Proteus mirabilis]
MAENPLAEAQRESAGASTFGKYNYQFHWALCEIIEKHKNKKEYALLIEYHEDVVIADSLDADVAQFEFYQVKNQKAAYTPASLTKRKKGANDTLKNSVLGKLLSSCINTEYEDRITTIGLVSSSGFSLNLDKGLKLDVIRGGDIAASDLASLTQDIDNELGIKVLPEHLQFIVPDIQLKNQEDYVLSRFARLVNELFPGAFCNPVNIYRSVVDEMGRIGRVEYDYRDWARLIEKKSLTSTEVHDVITQHTTHPCVDDLKSDFDDLARDLGWKAKQKRTFKSKLAVLALRRAGFMSALDIEITNAFKQSHNKVDENNYSDDNTYLEALQKQAIEDCLLVKVNDQDELLLEVIYCLLKAN